MFHLPNRRRLLGASIAMLAAVSLAACSSGASDAGSSTSSTSETTSSSSTSSSAPETSDSSTSESASETTTEEAPPETTADAADASNPLGLITPGELRLAYVPDHEPLSFVDGDKPGGMFVDMGQYIADKLGLRTVWVAVDLGGVVPAVANHQYDLGSYSNIVTPERLEVVDFTTPVSYTSNAIVSLASNHIEPGAGAAGKTIGVIQGSSLIPLLEDTSPDAILKTYAGVPAMSAALDAGQIDGFFTGFSESVNTLKDYPQFSVSENLIATPSELAFSVAKDRPGIKDAVNQALADMMADGTFNTLYSKWQMGSPGYGIPQRMLDAYPTLKQIPDTKPLP